MEQPYEFLQKGSEVRSGQSPREGVRTRKLSEVALKKELLPFAQDHTVSQCATHFGLSDESIVKLCLSALRKKELDAQKFLGDSLLFSEIEEHLRNTTIGSIKKIAIVSGWSEAHVRIVKAFIEGIE